MIRLLEILSTCKCSMDPESQWKEKQTETEDSIVFALSGGHREAPGVFGRKPTLGCCQQEQKKPRVSWVIFRNTDLRVGKHRGRRDSKLSPFLIKDGLPTGELCSIRGQKGHYTLHTVFVANYSPLCVLGSGGMGGWGVRGLFLWNCKNYH